MMIRDEDLIPTSGEVPGLHAGDRVRYSDKCYTHLRGRLARVKGFDQHGQVVTQPDGQDGYATTRADHAVHHLIKVG